MGFSPGFCQNACGKRRALSWVVKIAGSAVGHRATCHGVRRILETIAAAQRSGACEEFTLEGTCIDARRRLAAQLVRLNAQNTRCGASYDPD